MRGFFAGLAFEELGFSAAVLVRVAEEPKVREMSELEVAPLGEALVGELWRSVLA